MDGRHHTTATYVGTTVEDMVRSVARHGQIKDVPRGLPNTSAAA